MVEDREARAIRLLMYALRKKGIPDSSYLISNDGLPPSDESHVMAKIFESRWVVYYSERGKRTISGEFQDIFHASRFFYWNMTATPSQYLYREEFDRRTSS
jgi:hypothetical protein